MVKPAGKTTCRIQTVVLLEYNVLDSISVVMGREIQCRWLQYSSRLPVAGQVGGNGHTESATLHNLSRWQIQIGGYLCVSNEQIHRVEAWKQAKCATRACFRAHCTPFAIAVVRCTVCCAYVHLPEDVSV
jgi:hypothetical protein